MTTRLEKAQAEHDAIQEAARFATMLVLATEQMPEDPAEEAKLFVETQKRLADNIEYLIDDVDKQTDVVVPTASFTNLVVHKRMAEGEPQYVISYELLRFPDPEQS